MLKTLDQVDPAFRADVINGLAEPIPAIPARWFYDRRGSELFDDITRLPSYYPTRTETALLEAKIDEIARLLPKDSAVVEFGSGSSTKTPILLRATNPKAYVPIDISGDYLRESAARVDAEFPGIPVHPVEADFTNDVELPAAIDGLPRLGFFPGSTIGNFIPQSATDLLRHFRRHLGTGAKLLIGMDRVKPIDRLIAAYDDPEGVTAEFNLNLLRRINRELDWRHPRRRFPSSGTVERHARPDRDAPGRDARRRVSKSRAAGSPLPKASRSTPKTATNMARAVPACCCSPAAGPRWPNGPTLTRISR